MLDLLLIAAGAASVAIPPSQPAAEFVGAWILDPVRSDFAADHPTADYRVTKVISWNGLSLTETDDVRNLAFVGFALGDAQTRVELTPDGVEREVTGIKRIAVLPLTKMAVTASWQGDNLFIQARGMDSLGYWKTTRRYFLSRDGDTLTELIIETGDQGDSEKRLVFTRASATPRR